MEIQTFKAKCSDCRSEFARPELGDMAYGEFIFTGSEGTVFCYFRAIGNPVIDAVERLVKLNSNFSSVFAFLADAVDGQKMNAAHICPVCRSTKFDYWSGARVGSMTVQDASFTHYLSLQEPDQIAAIRVAISGIVA